MSSANPVLVICAMESEAVHLRNVCSDVREEPIGRWRRSRGKLHSVDIDIVVSGIGLAYSAAATTAALMDRFPAVIVNYGCAGAHRADVSPGDVVIASAVVHLASYIHRPDGTKHHFGFRFADSTESERTSAQIATDPLLLDTARRAAKKIALPAWPGREGMPNVHVGPVGSADVWTQHLETIDYFHANHQTLCEDMEAASVAQIATLFGVPFLAIKDISNNEIQNATVFAGADSGASLLDDVVDEVGRRAAILTGATIAQIGKVE